MNLVSALVLGLYVAATASAPEPSKQTGRNVVATTKTRGKREARVIPLDEKQARAFHTLYTHPSIPAILEFPEPFLGTPTCGDCVDGSTPPETLANSDALFVVDLFPTEQYISIKPAQYSRRDGGRVPDEHFITTLTVRLASKLTITVKVQYGTVDNADARVTFTLPNRAKESQFVQEQVAKARADLEADFARRVNVGIRQSFMQGLAEQHECVKADNRARKDDVVVEVRELCRFGSSVYIRFEVENRSRNSLVLGDVQVGARSGKQVIPFEGAEQYLPQREVEFQKSVVGVVSFSLDDLEQSAKQFQLVIAEQGGRNREVIVPDVRF